MFQESSGRSSLSGQKSTHAKAEKMNDSVGIYFKVNTNLMYFTIAFFYNFKY